MDKIKYTTLKLSDNSKTKFEANIPNTFGLAWGDPSKGGTCPGSTKGAGGCCSKRSETKDSYYCYVSKMTRIYKQVGVNLQQNTDLVREALDSGEIVQLLRMTVLKWLLSGGLRHQYFRIHWSGDMVNEDYAIAWSKVIREYPLVKFWMYTRSFVPSCNVLPILAECKNLSLYLSLDPVNYKEGLEAYQTYKEYKNVALCFMGNTVPEELTSEFKFIGCPEIRGKIKNEKNRGACSKCKLCMTHTDTIKLRNIQFPIH